MFSRKSRVLFWFLLISFLIFEGETNKKDINAYCDVNYRSKYPVIELKILEKPKNTSKPINVTEETVQDDDSVQSVNTTTINSVLNNDDDNSNDSSDNRSDESQENSTYIDNLSQEVSTLPTNGRSFTQYPISTTKAFQVSEIPIISESENYYTPNPFRRFSLAFGLNFGGRRASIEMSMERRPFKWRRKREASENGDWNRDRPCKPGRRIIGGSVVENIEELPYVVLVDSGCGGSLISHSWVLTAAHCVHPNIPKYVYAGSLKLFGGCKHRIKKAIKHPKYDEKKFLHDIALLKLREPFVVSRAIKPITMSNESPKPGDCGVVSGWGKEFLRGSMVYDMRSTMLPVVEKKMCMTFAQVNDGQFCAGYRDGYTDACQGDSGGPFVVDDNLVGIVSYGYLCAVPKMPGVYVDVSRYRKWIKTVAGL